MGMKIMQLENKKIIVTGGTSGMGAAAVEAFVGAGAEVAVLALNKPEKQITGVHYYQCNVADKKALSEAIDAAVDVLGGVDSLFCIAGINQFIPTLQLREEDIDKVFAVNVKGVIFAAQAVFPYMKENGGAIINFGSQAASNPGPDSAHYAAAKAAVAAFSAKIAAEWGKYNIRVNTVLPAAWTPLFEKTVLKGQKVTPELKQQVQKQMGQAFPLGYLGDPLKDIAPALVFLASDAAHYITGQQIAINGGSAMVR